MYSSSPPHDGVRGILIILMMEDAAYLQDTEGRSVTGDPFRGGDVESPQWSTRFTPCLLYHE